MTIRPRFFVALALSLILVSGVALAISSLQLVSGPTPTAQVGVPYSSGLTASGGNPPYTFSVVGLLPPGLTLSNPTTGAITGTPNSPGVYTFTGVVTDTVQTEPNASPTVTDNAAARRRTLAQSGTHAASVSSPGLSITVSFPTPPSPTPVPPSVWMAMTGLAGAGLFRLRQKRRS